MTILIRNLVLIIAGLLFICCTNFKRDNAHNIQPKDSKKDYLNIVKDTGGFLIVEYKLKNVNFKKDTIRIRYFDYYDVIFPLNGVSVIKADTFKLYGYKLVKDSILFVPVLANNNSLSLNIIDLKNKNVITNDIRTSLTFVWVKEGSDKIEFVISNTPEIEYEENGKEKYKYVLSKYELKNNALSTTKIDSVEIDFNIKDDTKREFEIANRMFLPM